VHSGRDPAACEVSRSRPAAKAEYATKTPRKGSRLPRFGRITGPLVSGSSEEPNGSPAKHDRGPGKRQVSKAERACGGKNAADPGPALGNYESKGNTCPELV